MIYLMVFLLIGITGLMSCKINLTVGDRKIDTVDEKKTFLLFSMMLFSFVAAFRGDGVGADTKSYVQIFEWFCGGMKVAELPASASTVELIYIYFIKTVSMFSHSRIVFLLIQALVIYGFFLNYIRKYSKDIIFSIIMFYSLFYTSTLNLMRQYLAIALIVYALDLINEKKYKMAILIVLLAISLHKSAILNIPILLIYLIKNKNKYIVLFQIVLFAVAGLISSTPIVERVLRLMGYGRYVNRLQSTAGSSGIMAMIYLCIIVLGMVIWLINKRNASDEYCRYLMLSSVGTLFAVLSVKNEMYARVGTGYLFFIVILFPMVLQELLKRAKIKKVIMLAVYLMLFVATYVSSRGYTYTTAF